MKNIKKIAGFAGGVFGALLASPFTAMAETAPAETAERSLGETMGYALLNTVMGIVIVFLVLVLIAWIISLFKYINKFETSRAAKKAAKEAPKAEEAPEALATLAEEASEELSDDLELVAVITAAIHAYEEAQGNDVPADGLVVRSIRKVNKAKWQNA